MHYSDFLKKKGINSGETIKPMEAEQETKPVEVPEPVEQETRPQEQPPKSERIRNKEV